MKLKTNLLSNELLDWAVAQAEMSLEGDECYEGWHPHLCRLNGGELTIRHGDAFMPSTDPRDTYKLQISHAISVDFADQDKDQPWEAFALDEKFMSFKRATGETPLVATSRCFVALVLGDEIDPPVWYQDKEKIK